jgi:hypothetical protein
MVEEKRQAPRIRVNINARWEGVLTRHFGTVTDISRTGCFILTVDAVSIKELLRVEIQMLNGKWIYFWGEVVYRAPEIGFGLRFTGTNDAEQKMIDSLVEYAASIDGEVLEPEVLEAEILEAEILPDEPAANPVDNTADNTADNLTE